ncbi:hypothetical protein L1987_33110 [Smallanthus sonchifolius]|uniref:Uncharacterized protein n=1 Tax=Smallanthus sonchifolius TaxID=185202 RepID=A0ACB9HRH7_9ASTR|nr:hypothetical protein L1987_33110 [Smallanthus sonchifolius]
MDFDSVTLCVISKNASTSDLATKVVAYYHSSFNGTVESGSIRLPHFMSESWEVCCWYSGGGVAAAGVDGHGGPGCAPAALDACFASTPTCDPDMSWYAKP